MILDLETAWKEAFKELVRDCMKQLGRRRICKNALSE